MIEHFLTTEQVADILQVHPFTILKLIKSGKLKGVKLGRVYRIKESDVHTFLEQSATSHATEGKERSVEKKTPHEEKDGNYYVENDENPGENHYYII